MERSRVAAALSVMLLLTGCAAGAVAPEPAAGARYGFEIGDIEEALTRGEGRAALAYYERAAAELDGRGAWLPAAKAHGAVVWVAMRLGAYQKGIRSGLRALELLKRDPSRDGVLFWAGFGLTGAAR